MKKLLPLICVLLWLDTSAQKLVPGYLGRHVSLGYTFSICPNLYGEDYDYHPILTETAHIGYIFSQQHEVTFSVDYYTKKIDNGGSTSTDPTNRFNLFGYALGLKRFRKMKFAPLGAYHQCQAIMYHGSIAFNPYQLKNTSGTGPAVRSYSGGKLEAQGFGFAYSIGIQRMVSDRLALDLGLKGLYLFFADEDLYHSSYEEHLLVDGPESLMTGLPFLNGYIGLRFLAH
ncbi:MAG: hypothetical protein ACJ77K_09860 [Bacteroidia bacterium]